MVAIVIPMSTNVGKTTIDHPITTNRWYWWYKHDKPFPVMGAWWLFQPDYTAICRRSPAGLQTFRRFVSRFLSSDVMARFFQRSDAAPRAPDPAANRCLVNRPRWGLPKLWKIYGTYSSWWIHSHHNPEVEKAKRGVHVEEFHKWRYTKLDGLQWKKHL